MSASISIDASKDEAAPPSNTTKGEIELLVAPVVKEPTDEAKAAEDSNPEARAENAANDVSEERDDVDVPKSDTKQDKPVVKEDDSTDSGEEIKNQDTKDPTKKRGSPTAQPEGHPEPKKFIMEESFALNASNDNNGYPVIAPGAIDTPLPKDEN